MNLILFESGEWRRPLPLTDKRAIHILEILKLKPGDRLTAGEIEGNWGSIVFEGRDEIGLKFTAPEFFRPSPPLHRLGLLIGTPRPPTAQRLLRDLSTVGIAEIAFAATELGEKSYLQSTLWKTAWRDALLEGAMQAKSTHLPTVQRFESLGKALRSLSPTEIDRPGEESSVVRLAFDLGSPKLAQVLPSIDPSVRNRPFVWLALGPERGWSEAERKSLAQNAWTFVGLDDRVLRTETACTVAAALVLYRLGGVY